MQATPSSKPLLQVEDLSTHYVSDGGRRLSRAVDGVSFTLHEGETLGVVGESGSGKSTLALSLLRLLPPAARHAGGRILFRGEDLSTKNSAQMRAIRGKEIAMILQDPMASLNPVFTIGDQVSEPLRVHHGTGRSQAMREAVDLLADVRIPAPERRVRDYPHQMSGGMRQRVVGAIGIACKPRLLIADEPTTSLDLTIQAQYLELLQELQRQHGLAMIIITHNLGIVAEMCDQVAVMYGGRIVEMGSVRQLFDAPAHPYSEALIRSIPKMDGAGQRLAAIAGQPPDPAQLPSGCAFHPRCPRALPVCRESAPPVTRLSAGHETRCWLYPEAAR